VPDQAYVYATALGCYKLYRNGELVSFRELTPGCRDHRYHQTYQVYDVTVLLQKGATLLQLSLSTVGGRHLLPGLAGDFTDAYGHCALNWSASTKRVLQNQFLRTKTG